MVFKLVDFKNFEEIKANISYESNFLGLLSSLNHLPIAMHLKHFIKFNISDDLASNPNGNLYKLGSS